MRFRQEIFQNSFPYFSCFYSSVEKAYQTGIKIVGGKSFMFKYEGAKCPVCHGYLMEEDDIVVCPVCGAPHHRDCWNYLKHCGCPELHAQGKSWTPPVRETASPPPPHNHTATPPPSAGGQETIICPVCRTVNQKTNMFCTRCGNSLINPASPNQGNMPPPSFFPFGGAPVNPVPVADPLGGVSPQEEIDGVKAKDLAAIVGQNSTYYLPRFRAMSQNPKTKTPNFAAFFFSAPWMLFRRMIWPGIGLLLVTILLEIPNYLIAFQSVSMGNVVSQTSASPVLLYVSFLCVMLSWGIKAFFCFFGNKFYMKRCVKLAKKLRETTLTEDEFQEAAKKHGGTKPLYLYILVGLFVVAYLVYFWFVLVV